MVLSASIVIGLSVFVLSMVARGYLLDHIASRKFVTGKENYEL